MAFSACKCLEFWEIKINRENQGGTEKSVPPFLFLNQNERTQTNG